ncbi:MAG: hypothetical protein AAB270_06230 [Chloroflexota bacterium]
MPGDYGRPPLAERGSTLLAPVCPCCGMVHCLYIIDTVKSTISSYHPARPLNMVELRQATEGIPLRDFADVVVAGEG